MKSEQTKRLDTAGIEAPDWEQALALSRCADELAEANRLREIMAEHLGRIAESLPRDTTF